MACWPRPQAIGAQSSLSRPTSRQSVGADGGFATPTADFLTLVQQKLRVKIVVFNNGTLGFVALEMKASGFLETGTSLTNPDFGGDGTRHWCSMPFGVEDPGTLSGAIVDVLAHDGPALLHVVSPTRKSWQ